MADPPVPFDLKKAAATVSIYDGCAENLETFVDAARLLVELTPADQHAILYKFLKTRLTGTARQAINNAQEEDPNALIAAVTIKCADKRSAEQLITKIKTIKNRGNTERYCEEIEKATTALERLYVSQQMPDHLATKMAATVGVETLINGARNTETKIILKASKFTNINEATQKVLENDTQDQAVYMTQRKDSFRGNRSSYRGRRGRGNRGHHSNRQNNYQYNNRAGYPQNEANRYNPRGRRGHGYPSRGRFVYNIYENDPGQFNCPAPPQNQIQRQQHQQQPPQNHPFGMVRQQYTQ